MLHLKTKQLILYIIIVFLFVVFLDTHTESNELPNNYKDKNKEEHDIAQNLLNAGGLFFGQEKFSKSLECINKALRIYEQIDDKTGMANTLVFIGSVYEQLGDYTRALDFYRQSLKACSEQKNKYMEASTLNIMAYIYLELQDYQNAMDYFEQALNYEIPEFSCNILLNMGCVYYDQTKYEKAKECFEKALVMGRKMSDPDIWIYLQWLGKVSDTTGQFKKAKSYFSEVINHIESISGRIFIDEYYHLKEDFYNDMISLLRKLKEYEEAFYYIEGVKTRTLLDLLGNKPQLEKTKDKELILEEIRLRNKIIELDRDVQFLKVDIEKEAWITSPEWTEEMDQIEKEYAENIEKLKKSNPGLDSLGNVNPLTLKEVQEFLETDTTLLEYYVVEDTVECWVVDKKRYKYINQDASYLTSTITNFVKKIAALQPDYEKEAKELYDLLIEPVKPYIKTKRICIIPHSELHYLPFHALINADNQNRFLIEEYDIFYAPSASVLKFNLENRKRISGKVLAFGNPELGDKNLDLPHAEEEVMKIKESYPDTDIYLNENATEEKAKMLSGNYDIVHFATHGELNLKTPLFSSVRLANEKEEDGRLETLEIFNLNLKNTSLVTLSACQTGLGELRSGDELIGLIRAFFYAGTPSLVASLWMVNDQSTSELMNLFYKNLKTHSKVESLRMAQLEMINGEVGRGIVRGVGGITSSKAGKDKSQSTMTVNGSHPYFWAPFILLGDWN